jgi:hypothetical protein
MGPSQSTHFGYNSVTLTVGGALTTVGSTTITTDSDVNNLAVNGYVGLMNPNASEKVACWYGLDGVYYGPNAWTTNLPGSGTYTAVPLGAYFTGVQPGTHTVTMGCQALGGGESVYNGETNIIATG